MRRPYLAILYSTLFSILAATATPGIAQLLPLENRFFDQVNIGTDFQPEAAFGQALAAGDFNGDGLDDLAIGAPDRDISTASEAGSVFILSGTSDGLTTENVRTWTRNAIAISGFAQASDRFGAALAAGDFDDDGYDDLAIGIPGATVIGHAEAGAVVVLFGSSTGFQSTTEFITQSDMAESEPEPADRFGSVLVAGDFNGDGHDDLAVGSPDEDWNQLNNAGLVQVLAGDAAGLLGNDSVGLTQLGLGTIEANDRFGASLAAGHFSGDSADDLVVGAPGEVSAAGRVFYFGGGIGPQLSGMQPLSSYEPSDCSFSDQAFGSFGFAVTAGNFDGDSYQDIAVGAPGIDNFEGRACVFFGDEQSPRSVGLALFQLAGWNDQAEPNDFFGFALAAGDFDGGGATELVVGIPGEDLNEIDAGMITVFPGDAELPFIPGPLPVELTQDSPGIIGVALEGHEFGHRLVVGDFNGDLVDDLAITVPGESGDAGAVIAMPGGANLIMSDGFESGTLSAWDEVIQ